MYCNDLYDAVESIDVLLILTEWKEFQQPDFSKIKKNMKQPIIYDGRNLYDPIYMKSIGFNYNSIGRPMDNMEKQK